jgi:signal transduction histidine kinase/pSer/pThr/pTyr-binding forkhead associated (FHA) protein
MPRLIVQSGPDAGKQFDLLDSSLTVGRHSSNAVCLSDGLVSRKHCELRLAADGHYQLFDLNSGNGTLWNGRPIQVIDLHAGDQIRIGETTLIYTAGSSVQPKKTSDRARLIVQETSEPLTSILHKITPEAGSQLLSRPDRAPNDWLRSRLATLGVLYEATSATSHILDVNELLGRIMELILRTTDADHGCVLLLDPETKQHLPKAVRSRMGADLGSDFVVSRTIVDLVLREGQGVLLDDIAVDERFRYAESVARHGIRKVICVPMKGRHETVGVLFLSSQLGNGPTQFTEDHLKLAIAVAHQSALAVEETRYHQGMLQAERLAAVGQTIAAMSHHIKNIMQGVRFGSDMVRMGLRDDDKDLLQKGWRLVEKNQTRIDELILDMLNYSKERDAGYDPTNLNDVLEDVLDVVRGRANDYKVSLKWDRVADMPMVPCDADGIHRALLNITSNAIDAVIEDVAEPQVKITVQKTPQFLEIRITDNGPGIPEETREEIFKPFVSSKGAKGTGLGLPVSRKVMREHGGDVIVESTGPKGTTFLFTLPLERK